MVEKVLKDSEPPEPDDEMLRTDPTMYMRQKATREKWEKKMGAVESEQKGIAERRAAEEEARRQRVLGEEGPKLLEAIPEWKDEKVAEKEAAEIATFLKEQGYTDQQIDHIEDHRLIKLIRDAVQFRKLVEEGKKLAGKGGRKKGVKTLKPGGRERPTPTGKKKSRKVLAQKRERLARSGRVGDAESMIYDLLDDD